MLLRGSSSCDPLPPPVHVRMETGSRSSISFPFQTDFLAFLSDPAFVAVALMQALALRVKTFSAILVSVRIWQAVPRLRVLEPHLEHSVVMSLQRSAVTSL